MQVTLMERRYDFKLFVSEPGIRADLARWRARTLLWHFLHDDHRLDVIDITQDPAAAKAHGVATSPTLVLDAGTPAARRLVGTFSDPAEFARTFGLELPRAAVPPAGRKEVLLVEDDERNAEPLARLLKFGGHTVRWEKDGRAALAALEGGFEPEVVLLDIMMPVMNGYEFLERLRGVPRWTELPVVVMSAMGPSMDVKRLRAQGVSQIMQKGAIDFVAFLDGLN